MNTEGKVCFEKQTFIRAPGAVQNGTFGHSQNSSPQYPHVNIACFTNSYRNKVLKFFLCFFILGAACNHQKQKGLRLGPGILSEIEVKHEIKPTSLATIFL